VLWCFPQLLSLAKAMITITKTSKINASLNTTIMIKIIGAIMIDATLAITITIIGTPGTGTMGAIGTTA
jgi:hypothetical protein